MFHVCIPASPKGRFRNRTKNIKAVLVFTKRKIFFFFFPPEERRRQTQARRKDGKVTKSEYFTVSNLLHTQRLLVFTHERQAPLKSPGPRRGSASKETCARTSTRTRARRLLEIHIQQQTKEKEHLKEEIWRNPGYFPSCRSKCSPDGAGAELWKVT